MRVSKRRQQRLPAAPPPSPLFPRSFSPGSQEPCNLGARVSSIFARRDRGRRGDGLRVCPQVCGAAVRSFRARQLLRPKSRSVVKAGDRGRSGDWIKERSVGVSPSATRRRQAARSPRRWRAAFWLDCIVVAPKGASRESWGKALDGLGAPREAPWTAAA